jgi:hypothetical protein
VLRRPFHNSPELTVQRNRPIVLALTHKWSRA